MKYEYIKFTQIIVLCLVAVYQQNSVVFVGCLLMALLGRQRHLLSSFMSVALVAVTLFKQIQMWKGVIIGFMVVLLLLGIKFNNIVQLRVKYIIPVFLMSLSLQSINQNYYLRAFQLSLFFYFLLLTYYQPQPKYKPSLYIANIILVIEALIFSFQQFPLPFLEQPEEPVQQWWYFMSFPLTIQCATFIVEVLKKIANQDQFKVGNNVEGGQSEEVEIQMKDMQGKDPQDYFREIQLVTDNQKQTATKPHKHYDQNRQHNLTHQPPNNPITPTNNLSQPHQSQVFNLVLIIPFTLQPSTGLLSLPLYIYSFSLHFNVTSRALHLLALVTCFGVLFLVSEKGLSDEGEVDLDNSIILRMALVLLVNKNIQLLNQVAEIVKKLWLRSSFVLVLAVMFWFALKTVNVFHILLTIVLLIFVSAKGSTSKNQFSYRHKHWIYLLIFFDIFLLFRQLYHLALYYNLYNPKEQSLVSNILSLSGLSYPYQSSLESFNLTPMVISIFVALQYLTYQSKIYTKVRESPILPYYQQKINFVIKLLTILYYKLIPWLSYAFLFAVILSLEFSCITLLLLVCLLITLAVQVQRKNQLRTYEIMYSLWSILQRLFAVQVILRYAFEFLNFPLFYQFFHRLPFFQTIERYKQFLGLAIREGDYVYFKAFTKFQVMIGLDFACIFVSFLVIEYYRYLIAFHYDIHHQPEEELSREKQVIREIYTQYIDFKLTLLLKKWTVWLKRVSKGILLLYYPALGIYCCLKPSVISLLFFIISIVFYLRKNSQNYAKFIKENLLVKVKELFLSWKQESSSRQQLYEAAMAIYESMIKGKKLIRFDELMMFEKMRKFLLLLASSGIIINYASRVFELEETSQLFGKESQHELLKVRWCLYVGGVSVDSVVKLIELLVILASTIIQVKCTRFLAHLYDLSAQKTVKQSIQMNLTENRRTDNKSLTRRHQSQNALEPEERTLYASLLEKNEQNQQQLKKQLQENESLNDADQNPQLKKQIQSLRQESRYNDLQEQMDLHRSHSQFMKKKEPFTVVLQNDQGLHRQSQTYQQILSQKQLKKFIQMKTSLFQGVAKLIERCFVMVLVFLSIIENHHPFGIVYLVCSMFLTFLGAYSILNLSRVFGVLIVMEYVLVVINYANFNVVYTSVPQFKDLFQSANTFEWLNIGITPEWEQYLTFGDSLWQTVMMVMSWVVLFGYQGYFQFLKKSWQKILDYLTKKLAVSTLQKRIYQYSNLMYTYFLIYSPLCITICCLGIYLLDFTITNLFLTCVSILFLFKSVLVEQYSGSRQFWRLYFYILQFFIVVFILIYDVLSVPMFNKYCNRLLCSQQQFHTKFYKAGLLFVLQVGIDLMKSSYFQNALDNLKFLLSHEAMYSRLAIAYRENDYKIEKKFNQLEKELQLTQQLEEVNDFLEKYKSRPEEIYKTPPKPTPNTQTWTDWFLSILPTFVDSTLVLTSQQSKQYVFKVNEKFIEANKVEEWWKVNDMYEDEFGEVEDYETLKDKIDDWRVKMGLRGKGNRENRMTESVMMNRSGYDHGAHNNQQDLNLIRRSISQQALMPYSAEQFCQQQIQQIRQSLITCHHSQQQKQKLQSKQKSKLLFLLILQSTISNWHYLTYFFLILQHLLNLGLLTLPLPIVVFCYGLISPYQAPKNVWRSLFLLVLLPIMFKFAIAIGLVSGVSDEWIRLLIGDNRESIWLEYLVVMFVLVECLVLKIIGLWDESVTEVESMKMGLIRKIINLPDYNESQPLLLTLLKSSLHIPQSPQQIIFSRTEQKPGKSYTTILTFLQLSVIFYQFFFYDQMAIRKEVTIYQMISYNQFTAGMVILTLIQLAFILLERIIMICDFGEMSQTWEVNLLIKYFALVANLLYTEMLVLVIFPFNSGNFTNNWYIFVFYLINVFVFLVSALQIKSGIDLQSKGFMDRYTWYNGFVYTGFRAVPFLFEFKVFSDWTFTKTALRLFDWIKLEEIFGRMYVAKCNAIFLQGKVLGSRIQWWKKLLMGFPLLLAIILLIFGPLILFSNLNPLASKNSISAGYLQLCLKVNRTNEYVFYTNSHITDIVMLTPNQHEKQLLQSYDIQEDTVQVINLEEYSDQYWEISEGSYLKLLEQPKESLYEIVIRMKFQRNQTGSTPTYTVSTFEIPQQEIEQFKLTLQGKAKMVLNNFLHDFLRLDNNNGLHFLGQEKLTLNFYAQQAKKSTTKKYWIIQNGLKIKIASDKYTKAIFGYSVMSFYISIILVIANYFRFLFTGSTNTIILNDIPFADPIIAMINGIYKARADGDLEKQQKLFWQVIDLLRSPDQIKSLAGSYLQARIDTLDQQNEEIQDKGKEIEMNDINEKRKNQKNRQNDKKNN